jgi:hypothetical protein
MVCKPLTEPDFKQIVDKALALFAVYTGATLSFFVKDFLFSDANLKAFHDLGDWLQYWGLYATVAVVALLLRYIIGSAVHLNFTYVPRTTQRVPNDGGDIVSTKTYRSTSVCQIFVDLLFLILFGILAVFITRRADNIHVLMWDSVYFVSAGFLWSLLALPRPENRAIGKSWLKVDGIQIFLTIAIIFLPIGELGQAIVLGATYLAFLFVDCSYMVKKMS